jgi:hypothetical protein
MMHVLHRLFPFSRSLFEDKVANLWCAAEPLLKLRERTYADESGWTRQVAISAATVATFVMMTPALVGLWTYHVAASPGHPDAQKVSPADLHRIETDRIKQELLRDKSHVSTTGAAVARVRRRREVRAADSDRTHISGYAHNPAGSDVDNVVVLVAPWEVLLLALLTVAMAFFLASYQVHEKTVLLPVLPAVMLSTRLPLLSVWLSSVALWSLWPLLSRDGLLAPMCVLGAGYAVSFWPSLDAIRDGDARFVLATLRHSWCSSQRRSDKGGNLAAETAAAQFLQKTALVSALPALGISLWAAICAPPAHLPDLYSWLTAVYACVVFFAVWLWGSTVLLLARSALKSDE